MSHCIILQCKNIVQHFGVGGSTRKPILNTALFVQIQIQMVYSVLWHWCWITIKLR